MDLQFGLWDILVFLKIHLSGLISVSIDLMKLNLRK